MVRGVRRGEGTETAAAVVLGGVAAAAVLAAIGCAVNPATGKRELMLVGETREAEIGREHDRGMVARLGAYDDEALQAYVQDVGQRLAAVSERSDLSWTFRVLDDPVVNAFALPGGYVYVTRGILAHLESEAELAAVLGHEIGHVTARHGAAQMSKAMMAELGLGLGAVLAPERTARYGEWVGAGAGLLFLRFSRDDEREADDLGLRYLRRAGYDPGQMSGVFTMLDRVGREGGPGPPGWLATHPAPENRARRIADALAAGAEAGGGRVEREPFLARLEGLVFGPDPRQGYFRDAELVHPTLRFRLQFPEGWKLTNHRTAVQGTSPAGDARLTLTPAAEDDPQAALASFLGQEGVSEREAGAAGRGVDPVPGLPAAAADFRAGGEGQEILGRAVTVQHDGRVYRLLGYARAASFAEHEAALLDALRSFAPLQEREARAARPQRVHLVRSEQNMGLGPAILRFKASVPAEVLRRLNRMQPGEAIDAHRAYKFVTGGRQP